MKDILKDIKWKNVMCFVTVGIIFVAIICCCYGEINNVCDEVVEAVSDEQNLNEGIKCRQCGKNLKHKGFFCSSNCRERYANEYYRERYSDAICRNCGKKFIKKTASEYFCGLNCQLEYYGDLRMVGEAEEYRKSKQKVEAE